MTPTKYRLVPCKPTKEMVDATTHQASPKPWYVNLITGQYAKMLATAPKASEDEEFEQMLTVTIWSAGGCDMSEARFAARAVLKMLEGE